MEFVLGVLGLVITILLWLFPPEPLRRMLRLPSSNPVETKDKETVPKKERRLTEAFKATLEDLEIIDDDEIYMKRCVPSMLKREPPPRIIKRADRDPLLTWVDSLDDELLLVTLAVREYWRGKDWRKGIPRRVIVQASHPSGRGRGVPELESALIECGVLVPRQDREWFDYGANLQRALDCIDLVDWDKLKENVA